MQKHLRRASGLITVVYIKIFYLDQLLFVLAGLEVIIHVLVVNLVALVLALQLSQGLVGLYLVNRFMSS